MDPPSPSPAASIALQRWLIGLLVTAVAVVVCYLWVDRPLALLAHAHSGQRETFARFTHIPDLLNPVRRDRVRHLRAVGAGAGGR